METITWSGDSGQIARKLEFTNCQEHAGPKLPNVTINEGDFQVHFPTDNGTFLFDGIIFDIEKDGRKQPGPVSGDLIFHLIGSELTKGL